VGCDTVSNLWVSDFRLFPAFGLLKMEPRRHFWNFGNQIPDDAAASRRRPGFQNNLLVYSKFTNIRQHKNYLLDHIGYMFRPVNRSSSGLQQSKSKMLLKKLNSNILYSCKQMQNLVLDKKWYIHYLFIPVINQLDAQNFCFTISLFHASTCFEHTCLSSGGQNCIIQPLVSSHL